MSGVSKNVNVVNLLFQPQITTTTYSTEGDLRYYYLTPGHREMTALCHIINCTTSGSDTGTVIVNLQESTSSATGDYADISGATFTTFTGDSDDYVNSTIRFHTKAASIMVRAVATVVGAPKAYVTCDVLAEARSS